jgi:hypothetical protein
MGFDAADPSADFWNFIIPGVGRVPIYAFLGLMTGFVIFIGPLNYMYLRRRGKLHLMIVTVPLCAAVVTFSLFAYALVSDGLGVRVRARSYTQIDQRRGEAVCWSRLCYYAGLAPSQGLTFSGDVAVMPIAGNDDRREGEARQVTWTPDGQQHLRSGWLRSRTLTQYYTIRSRRSEAQLVIDAHQNGLLKVINQLGTPIQQVLVCDADGQVYYGEHLAPDVAADLAAAEDASAASLAILGAFHQNRLQPADMMGGRRATPPPAISVVVPNPGMPNAAALGGTSISRLEAGLADVFQQLTDGKLDARSYVAIVERSPETELGTSAAQEEESFHVVVGRW